MTTTRSRSSRGVHAALARRRRHRTIGVVVALAGAVALALVVAVVASGGDEATPPGLAQTRPVTVTGASLPPFTGVDGDAAVGTSAPRAQGRSFDGTSVSLDPQRPTMVVFLAHWCQHCRAEVPRLVQWYRAGHVPAGLDVVGVATATDERFENYPPSRWLEQEDWPWPVLVDDVDSPLLAAYGLETFPGFVLLDGDGVVRLRVTGEVETTVLDALLEQALGVS